MKKWAPYLLSAAAGVLLVGFLAGPLALLLRVSLYEPARGRGFYEPGTWSASSYREILADPSFPEILRFTIGAGLGITLLTLLIAYPMALFIHSLPPRRKSIAVALVLLPKFCNLLVLVYGLQLILSSAGPISWLVVTVGLSDEPVLLYRNLTGMVIGETYLLLPYAILILLIGLLRIDPSLVSAARGLGATRWQAFWRVTWPLSLPGLVAAGQLTLLWASGAILGPLLLGGPQELTLGVEVQRQALENQRWPRAAATAVVLAILLLVSSAVAGQMGRWHEERRP
jgi:ABC-type spermidine/putrescine transport system permease subunit I